MALQIANFVSGRVDNVVFYKRMGTYVARSVPARVKQSAATKVRSRNFGVAAAAGKILRQLLHPVLPFPKDRSMQIRFSGAIAQWLGLSDAVSLPATNDIPFVNGFQFNSVTSIDERWKLPLTVTQPSADIVEVLIPAFVPTLAIAAPAYTVFVECTFTVATCKLMDGTVQGVDTKKISIPYNSTPLDAQVISFPVPAIDGSLVITAARLQYQMVNGQYNTAISFMPASVINASYIAG